jgi:hypothetical protein
MDQSIKEIQSDKGQTTMGDWLGLNFKFNNQPLDLPRFKFGPEFMIITPYQGIIPYPA